MFLISLSRDGERLTLRDGILRKPDEPAFHVTEDLWQPRKVSQQWFQASLSHGFAETEKHGCSAFLLPGHRALGLL